MNTPVIRQPPQPPSNYDRQAIILGAAYQRGNKYDSRGVQLHALQRDYTYALNSSQQLSCFSSSYGNLCVFCMPTKDIIYLNSLTYYLARLANLRHGHVHYLHDSTGENPRAEFFKYDRATRIFNRSNETIMKSDFINTFHGRVALRVKGLRVVDDYHIYLDTTVFQLKIDREDDVTTDVDANNECIFQ